jgi:hypothetical protein
VTWSRYLRAPIGKHTCSGCGKCSRFRLTAGYLAAVLAATCAYYGVAFAATIIAFPGHWHRPDKAYIAALLAIGCVVLIAFDKYFDGRHRKLEKVSEEAEPNSGESV